MTLFVVQAPGTDDEALVRARFLADRFSWAAFAFAGAWLLYRRLWLPFVIWAVAEIALLALVLPHASFLVVIAVDVLARITLGADAHRLRLAKGARRIAVTDLVEARDRDEAEAIFYSRHRPSPSEAAA